MCLRGVQDGGQRVNEGKQTSVQHSNNIVFVCASFRAQNDSAAVLKGSRTSNIRDIRLLQFISE